MYIKEKFVFVLLLLLWFCIEASSQTSRFLVEVGYNISSTYLKRVPEDSRIATLTERKAINGLHLGLGRYHEVSPRISIDYALIYDQMGFKTLIEQDQLKESYLGVRAQAMVTILKKAHLGLGGYISTKVSGEGLDEKSIYFAPAIERRVLNIGALGRLSFDLIDQLSIFAQYNFALTPLYTYDYPIGQFPLDLKLYYRYLQVGASYKF